MGKSIKKNYTYNLLYQLFLILVPILLTPYVARVLGADGSGQYSFTYSIVTYFTLFAALGFTTYGQRLLASHQGDNHQQSIDFWEIFIARLLPSIVTLVVYFIIVFANVFQEKYQLLLIINSINIVAVIFDLSFYFFGNEEFGKLAIRNVSIKLLGIAATFIFVRQESDLWIYTLIQCLSVLLGNLVLWIRVPKTLEKVHFKELKPAKHLPSTFILFIPTIASVVYTSLDKTLIGIITGSDYENGNYEYADKLVKMSLTVITSLGAVFVPRNSQLYKSGDVAGVADNIYKSGKFVFFIGLPICLGLIAVANNLIPWYLGEGYDKAATLLMILSPLVVIIGFSNVFGMQYLLPTNKDKRFTIAIVAGALINIALTIPFTMWLQSYGAAIATIIAELTVTIIMCIFIKKDISIRKLIKCCPIYVIASAVMFAAAFTLGYFLAPSILNSFIIVIVGVVIYFGILLIFKEEFMMRIIHIIKSVFRRKKKQ